MANLQQLRQQLNSEERFGVIGVKYDQRQQIIGAGVAYLLLAIPDDGLGPDNLEQVLKESKTMAGRYIAINWLAEDLSRAGLVEKRQEANFVTYRRTEKGRYNLHLLKDDIKKPEQIDFLLILPKYDGVSRSDVREILEKEQRKKGGLGKKQIDITVDEAMKWLDGDLSQAGLVEKEELSFGVYHRTELAENADYEAFTKMPERELVELILGLCDHKHTTYDFEWDEVNIHGTVDGPPTIEHHIKEQDMCCGLNEDHFKKATSEILKHPEEAAPLLIEALDYWYCFFYKYHSKGYKPIIHGCNMCATATNRINSFVRDLLVEIGESARPYFKQHVDDKNPSLRYASLAGLMQLGDVNAQATLEEELKSDSVGKVSYSGLRLVSEPKCLPLIINIAMSPTEFFRKSVSPKSPFSPTSEIKAIYGVICRIMEKNPEGSRLYLKDNFEKLMDVDNMAKMLESTGTSKTNIYVYKRWMAQHGKMLELAGNVFTREDTNVIETLRYYGSFWGGLYTKLFKKNTDPRYMLRGYRRDAKRSLRKVRRRK